MAADEIRGATPSLAEEDVQSMDGMSAEEEPLLRIKALRSSRGALAGAAIALAVLCTAASALARPPGVPGTLASGRRAAPVTVCELLEGPDFEDVVTENFMAIGRGFVRPEQRHEVRVAVAGNLANISGSLRSRHPEEHTQLGLLQLSQEQKHSVLNLLRHYSDPRVLSLGRDLAEALHKTAAEGGDRARLERHLAARLQPKVTELQQLFNELVPSRRGEAAFDTDTLVAGDLELSGELGSWHVGVQMTRPEALGEQSAAAAGAAHGSSSLAGAAARRLSSADTMSSTRDQVTTLFVRLEGLLGDRMPTAPARMLLFERAKEREKTTTGWERFANCFFSNLEDPFKIFDCLMTNCHRAMMWILKKLGLDELVEKRT